ncbi:CALS12 [Symbiodinium pilosum]|uniref:CALS12 protein n=1 Tax=Symbiodinium pilosum TaxID=2952 RepID=A0A812KD33_SYMPI|nr:CALS12 [Symbiodinium pilosum]
MAGVIRANGGDSWCICMWAFARMIEAVGCENVHLRCNATDLDFAETEGFADLLQLFADQPPDWVQKYTGLPRRVQIFLVRLSIVPARAAYKGFVNPLRHYNGFVLDIKGSESAEEVIAAVEDSFPDVFAVELAYMAVLQTVDNTPFDQGSQVHGLDTDVHPRKLNSKADMLTIRAVYYDDEGVVAVVLRLSPGLNNDLYTEAFNNMHARDLYIMRKILHANAVRLAPWDPSQDHSAFLRICKKYGMYVIPTFDLGYFLSTEARRTAFSERQSEVWKGFQKFVHQALLDTADSEDLILMWTINFGLNLNETTEEGPRSISVQSDIRDEYFQMLRVIRSAQWLQECGPAKSSCTGDRFKRPLGIPLLLDTTLRQDNIGWYLGFAETVWGTWPVDELSLRIDEKTFNRLRPLGAFDVWIAQSQPPTSRQGQTDLQQQLKWLNATMQESHNAFTWHDLSTQTLKNPSGDVLAGCDPGIGCTYPTKKLVITQFGFAAEAPMYGSVNEVVDPGLQQQLTGSSSVGLEGASSVSPVMEMLVARHPDFFDAFWASNRGSVSKASPILNLSEDIFAGFNVLMRGETSKHVDCLEWEKGREVSFNSASLFFTKVASGNVGVMRSRDLKVLTGSLNIADSFSFYFASVGFYLYNVVTDLSMRTYVVIFVLLTLSSKSLDDVGKLDSLLAAEWVISFGTLAMFPRLMELTLEFGVMEGIIRFLPSVPGAVLVFTFMNKSIAEAVGSTMQTGLANYISTGRPMANDHYGWRDCYFFYRESHYYPALRILIMYAVYRFLAETFNVAALPMMILLATALVWIVGPILFCPQPTLWSIRDDLSELWCFIVGASNADRQMDTKVVNLEEKLAASKADPRANLYDVWLFDKLKHKRAPVYARMMELLVALYFFVVMLAVVFGTMVDQIRSVVLLILVNYFILALWRVFGKPTILMMVSGVFWICSVPVVLNSQSLGGQYGTLLVAFILTFQGLAVVEKLLLLLAWAVLRPDPNCASMPETTPGELALKKDAARKVEVYDALVEYFYLNFMSYQWHLYVSIMLLVVNLITQLFVAIIEMLGGLQSWWLLGGKLKGGCFRVKRPEYKPPGNDHDPPSERQRQLSAFNPSSVSEGLRARAVNGMP